MEKNEEKWGEKTLKSNGKNYLNSLLSPSTALRALH